MKNKKSNLDAAFTTKKESVSPVRKSQGGIRCYSEVTAETVSRVRGEFVSATFNPVVTIAFKSITFNPSCVRFFPDSQHVTVSIDERKRCLIVEPAVEHDDNSLKIANSRNGKNVPRTCTTKLCPKLFYIMQWNPEMKYRITATFQSWDDKNMIFRLDNAVRVLPKGLTVEDDW
jgi:hypothetical protein